MDGAACSRVAGRGCITARLDLRLGGIKAGAVKGQVQGALMRAGAASSGASYRSAPAPQRSLESARCAWPFLFEARLARVSA